jgi:hypothetical protein
MSQNPELERLEGGLLAAGVTLLDEHKAAFEAAVAVVDANIVKTVVDAVNAKLTNGGIAGLAEAPIKKADVAAEVTLDAAADNAVDKLLDQLDSIAKAEAAKLSAA